jgi:lysophospholipase L1-like esterase
MKPSICRLICLVLLGLATACTTEALDSHELGLVSGRYVAQGDSYASGTGTREYYDAGCQRSVYSYARKLADQQGLALSHVACAGARIPDVRANQLSALAPDVGLVTISIGGNDAGFSRVITQCAKPWPWTCGGDIANARAFITNTLPGQLDALYTEIATRAPNAQVIVVGYPRIFNGQTCNFAARISAGEQRDLNGVADLLATQTAAVAAAHGFDFLDVRAAFDGHRICDADEWINGLSNPVGESYHPNRAGHDALTALLTQRL